MEVGGQDGGSGIDCEGKEEEGRNLGKYIGRYDGMICVEKWARIYQDRIEVS